MSTTAEDDASGQARDRRLSDPGSDTSGPNGASGIDHERLALVAAHTTNAVVITDATGHVEWVNPAFTRFTGYTLEDMMGRRPRDVLRHPDMDPALAEQFSDRFDRGEGFRGECPVRHKSGATVWAEVDIRPIHDRHGAVTQSVGVYTDVTERRRAEAALRLSETRYRQLFESSPVPMWVFDEQSMAFVAVNQATIDKYGYSRDEFLGMTIKDIRPEDDLDKLMQELSQRSGASRRLGVWRHRLKNGSIVLVEVASHRLEFAGRSARLVIAMDVTEKQAAQQEAAAWRDRYEAAIWSSGQVLYDWDIKSDLAVWSGDTKSILSYTIPELSLPNSWTAIIHPDDLALFQAEVDRTTQSGLPLSMEYRVRRKDGVYMWVSDKGHYLKDNAGTPVRLIGFVADVTDRHRAEAMRRRLEQDREALVARLKLQIERMPIGCVLLDQEGRFLDLNPAAEAIFGYKRDEAVGRQAIELIVPPELHTYVASIFARLASGDMLANGRNENRTKDGRIIICEWTNTPLKDEHGRFVGILSMAQDVTDKHRLEDQLRHSQKLEAVGQLASGVAHDFNNLLTAIFGYLSLARATMESDHPAVKALAQLEEAARQAAGVTSGLLTFSRKAAAERSPIRIAKVVEDAVKLLRRTLPASVKLIVRTDPAAQASILGDATQIQQIITNLAINARDAMPDGGELRIELHWPAPASALPPASDGGWVQLVVADTGVGMTPDVQARIFEPFFTTKPRGLGTGLGLSILHGIVQEHGGQIGVTSAPSLGTTFSIVFPTITSAPTTPAPIDPAQTPSGRGELILVGEDHQLVREIIGAALRSVGYEVMSVSDGPAVIRSMEELSDRVRLLVIDVDLPGMNGLDCLRHLNAAGLRRPTVVITGRATGLDDVELDEATVLLRKPFQVGQLMELVGNVMAGSRGGRL